jgi:riboflavin synthase alpha subunit
VNLEYDMLAKYAERQLGASLSGIGDRG